MATKKAAIVKAVDSNDLANAGIDVKLSKMEIADYIADKAKEELEARLVKLQKEIEHWQTKYHPVIPSKEQQAACDALTVATGKKFYCTLSYHWMHAEEQRWSVCIGTDQNDPWHKGFQNAVAMPANPDQIPENVDVGAMHQERQELQIRLQELGKKKHRTILLEKILASNDSGKKVLADLQGMVARAVNG